MATKTQATAEVRKINRQHVTITIKGISPVQTHRFGEKARQQLYDSTILKKSRTGKKMERDPEDEYKEALYAFGDGKVGFPSIMVKKAMVNACRLTDIPMTDAKQMFFVWGPDHDLKDYVPVNHVEPELHEAIVPAAKGKGATLSYRALYPEGWEADIVIEHVPEVISVDSLVNLLNLAGFSVGIGCQRPERGGQYGRFEVVTDG